LLAAALARYESAVVWERAVAWILVGLIVTLVTVGGYGLLAGHRSRQQSGLDAVSP
jgi:hypothetical protein